MLKRDAHGDLLFPIRPAPGRHFYVGHLTNNRQTLIARSIYGQMIMAIFDAGGTLIDLVHRELPSPPVFEGAGTIREVDEDDFQEYLQREFGFSPGAIRIKEFRIPREEFAVYHMPRHYEEFLKNPNSQDFDDNMRQAFPELIQQWHEQGNFVLEWGDDHWLDGTGEVVAS